MWINFNLNPKSKIVGDCTVRAIALSMNKTWEDIYMDLAMLGYRMKDMPMPLREFEYKEIFEAQTNPVPVEAVRELPDSDKYMTRDEFNDALKQINEKLDKLNYRKGYNKHEQSVQQS